MREAALSSPPQRAVALTQIAHSWFSPDKVNQVLDTPVKAFNNASPIQHARKGIEEFREARRYLAYEIDRI